MQDVLTSVIALWRFGSPPGLQLSQWKLTWECESSSSHSHTLFLAHALASLCLGRESKTRVATNLVCFYLVNLMWNIRVLIPMSIDMVISNPCHNWLEIVVIHCAMFHSYLVQINSFDRIWHMKHICSPTQDQAHWEQPRCQLQHPSSM
jgi:hypothetical protein